MGLEVKHTWAKSVSRKQERCYWLLRELNYHFYMKISKPVIYRMSKTCSEIHIYHCEICWSVKFKNKLLIKKIMINPSLLVLKTLSNLWKILLHKSILCFSKVEIFNYSILDSKMFYEIS